MRTLMAVLLIGGFAGEASAGTVDSDSAMTRLAALTSGSQTQKWMTPRPGVIQAAACSGENVRCDNPGDPPCCPDLFCDHPSQGPGYCRYE
jgi:hypothetical protein